MSMLSKYLLNICRKERLWEVSMGVLQRVIVDRVLNSEKKLPKWRCRRGAGGLACAKAQSGQRSVKC